jgi:hypothetical protein
MYQIEEKNAREINEIKIVIIMKKQYKTLCREAAL